MLISVIVPVYKVERYLPKCIESILQQTYQELEIILVDDGSPDHSGHICDEYAKKDPRIQVIHKKNGGVADARNVGIEQATGELIALVDSDDYIAPDMYEKLVLRMQEDGSDMAICNFLCVEPDGTEILSLNHSLPISDGVFTRDELFRKLADGQKTHYYATTWNKLYKRELFFDARYPTDKYYEDEFIAHHVIKNCNSISCVSDALYYYVQHPGSFMHGKATIKKLDSSGALLDRVNLLCKEELFYEAACVNQSAMTFIVEYYHELDCSVREIRCKLNEQRKECRQYGWQLFGHNIGWKNRMACVLFFLGITPYYMVYRWLLKKNRKKSVKGD